MNLGLLFEPFEVGLVLQLVCWDMESQITWSILSLKICIGDFFLTLGDDFELIPVFLTFFLFTVNL